MLFKTKLCETLDTEDLDTSRYGLPIADSSFPSSPLRPGPGESMSVGLHAVLSGDPHVGLWGLASALLTNTRSHAYDISFHPPWRLGNYLSQ